MLEIIAMLVMTHITIITVTLYLHRSQAHRSVEFHPCLSHFFRFWSWLTTGMNTKEWVAAHRLHHRYTDQPGDPHSPHVFGIWQIFFKGAWLYRIAAQDKTLVQTYGAGTVDDWLERKLYTPHPHLGLLLMLIIDLVLFGWWGVLIWILQIVWIPFWAAGVINGLGHWWGYRASSSKIDHSRNIIPWGIIVGGEELHANHHLDPSSAKLSIRWFEFDIGWMWLCLFRFCRLAKIR